MFWIAFRRTSPWAGSVLKAFFYKSLYDRDAAINGHNPGGDGAVGSYTRAQLEAFVESAKAALAAWPQA